MNLKPTAMRHKTLVGSSRTLLAELQADMQATTVKTVGLETFERMNEYFQLRRVASQESNRGGDVLDRSSRLGTHCLSAEGPTTDREQASDASSLSPISSARSTETVLASKPSRSRWCLASMTVTLIVFTTYRPYTMAYVKDHATAIIFDAVTWCVFLANYVCYQYAAYISTTEIQEPELPVDLLPAAPILLFCDILRIEHCRFVWIAMCIQWTAYFVCVRYHLTHFMREWARHAVSAESGMLGAIFFSRYGYLLRIASSVLAMVMFAHFIACVWSSLQPLSVFDAFDSAFDMHLHSIYEALQLLQGQGVTTKTPLQDAFGSIAVLIGSVVLAVVFGDVAVLVANFSANQTTYQRKRERVLATMDKLQLPAPLRERIHQYYEYLHAEYESLDGEVATFTKELSHTLQLEVVLFKYMDVVTHVSHWSECSADFQKQLVLAVSVRVYLPDDFIMRRGEVGVDCFVVSRGTCKQYAYEDGNWEQATLPPQLSGDQRPRRRRSVRVRRSSKVAVNMASEKAAEGPHSRFSISGFVMTDRDADPNSPYTSVKVLSRGQSIGAMALICNYERTTDLRAVSYVEMCVLDRVAFQRVLSQFPDDREIVLTKMVQHHVLTMQLSGTPSYLIDAVRAVKPSATVHTCVDMLVRAINPTRSDPTLVFGLNDSFQGALRKEAREFDAGIEFPRRRKSRQTGDGSTKPTTSSSDVDPRVVSTLLAMIHDIHESLDRIERHEQLNYDCTCFGADRNRPV